MTLTPEELSELEALAKAATPGPWCIESVGEKGDGSNMIGVAFDPDDVDCETPLKGWLKPFTDAGVEIDYYRDELVAVCDHSENNHNANAAYIAACSPEKILRLIDAVRAIPSENE